MNNDENFSLFTYVQSCSEEGSKHESSALYFPYGDDLTFQLRIDYIKFSTYSMTHFKKFFKPLYQPPYKSV